MKFMSGHKKFRNYMLTSAIIAAGTFGVFYAPIAGAFGVGVQPSTVEMTIKPGDRHRQVITIGNVHKTKTISMTMGLADWSLDKKGQLILNPPGETERSAADWIRFSPASVVLKPETSMDIIVEISVPYKIENKGDHRFALLATTRLPELNERGETSGVWNKYQLASLFYLTMTPSESSPVVSNVTFVNKDKAMLSMNIKNAGNAHARLKGTAYIKDETDTIIAETPLSTVVLDQGERDYNVAITDMDALTKGKEYTIDFRMKNAFSPQTQFKAPIVPIEPLTFIAP